MFELEELEVISLIGPDYLLIFLLIYHVQFIIDIRLIIRANDQDLFGCYADQRNFEVKVESKIGRLNF